MRVRRLRERKRYGGGDDGGGGGRQRRLFPKPALAKPPKPVPVAEPTLFGSDLLATLGGAVEYGQNSASPIRDYFRYSVKSDPRKPPVPVQQPLIARGQHAA